MFYNPISRRHFLRGLGGFSLSIPLLPSLLPKALWAQTALPKRFVALVSKFGVSNDRWLPSQAIQDGCSLFNSNNEIRFRSLSGILSEAGSISNVLGTRFNSTLLGKMNVIAGLDGTSQPFDHNGCFPLTASAESGSQPIFSYSIDDVLANSSIVYPGAPPIRALRLAPHYRDPAGLPADPTRNQYKKFSWTKSGGSKVQLSHEWDATSLFTAYFNDLSGGSSGDPPPDHAIKRLAIDRVYPDYQAVMSNPKLSGADKNKLDHFATLLRDLQSRLQTGGSGIECETPTLASEPDDRMDIIYKNHIDLAVLAMACQMTNVVVIVVNHAQNQDTIDETEWHEWISHRNSNYSTSLHDQLHGWMADRYKYLVDLMYNTMDSDGSTRLLDQSAVLWTSELGDGQWHQITDIPVVLAGGCGGALTTGNFIDYRQRPLRKYAGNDSFRNYVGRPYNELLITLMQAMGLSPADYEREGQAGFGTYGPTDYDESLYTRFFNTTAKKRTPLPLLWAG